MTPPRRLTLASDILRGYLGLGITTVVSFGGSAALGAAGASNVAGVGLFGGWAVLAIVQSVLTLAVFLPMSSTHLRQALRDTTPTTRRGYVLWSIVGGGATYWATSGAAIAVVSLMILVVNKAFSTQPLLIWLGVAVVIGSLVLIFTSYAVRYAREDAVRGGIDFPGDDRGRRFSDYLYLAIQVAATFSSSDVNLTTRRARLIVSANTLISFAFNSVIVALLVSVLINLGT